MILFFYNLALFLALVVSAPWWLFRMATTHKYREGLLERLGRSGPVRRRLGLGDGRPLIWIHAVSVGEVLAVSRLVKELDAALPEHRIVLSTTTRTGQALARERFGAARVFYCPLDLPWAVRNFLGDLKPHMLVLAETEFWPNLLSACFRRAIPVCVVNARISDRSWPRYRRLRALWKPFLSRLNRVLAQSQSDAERLLALGCAGHAVRVSGNLKFDVRAAQEAEATRLVRQAAEGRRLVVAGSTLDGEEAALLAAWPQLLAGDPRLLLVLAPRHPERFAAAASLLESSGLRWSRRSGWEGHAPRLEDGQIVLLDTIGELASLYSLAAVAFVGGSLIPAGGHNPLEPAQFGVPILMGPYTHNFRAIVAALQARQAILIASPAELPQGLARLLADREFARQLGASAKSVFEEQAGATARSISLLLEAAQ